MANAQTMVTRALFLERLGAWSRRADNEITYAHGAAKVTWQGQSSVLRAVMGTVSGGGANDVARLRQQLIADRQKAISSWEAARSSEETDFSAGEVQGYNLVLDLLKDSQGTW